jgi:hypothetical protein
MATGLGTERGNQSQLLSVLFWNVKQRALMVAFCGFAVDRNNLAIHGVVFPVSGLNSTM